MTAVYLPNYILFLVSLIPLIAWRMCRKREMVPGLCAKCGYDVRACGDICTECGCAIPATMLRKPVAGCAGAIDSAGGSRRSLGARLTVAIIIAKFLTDAITRLVLEPLHHYWDLPPAVAPLLSLPAMTPFTRRPDGDLPSMLCFALCLILNSLVLGYLASWLWRSAAKLITFIGVIGKRATGPIQKPAATWG